MTLTGKRTLNCLPKRYLWNAYHVLGPSFPKCGSRNPCKLQWTQGGFRECSTFFEGSLVIRPNYSPLRCHPSLQSWVLSSGCDKMLKFYREINVKQERRVAMNRAWESELGWLKGNLSFPSGSEVKVSACNAGELGSIPGSGRYSGEGNGDPLQYSCLEIPWMEEPGWLQSKGLQRVRHDWATSLSLIHRRWYFLHSRLYKH